MQLFTPGVFGVVGRRPQGLRSAGGQRQQVRPGLACSPFPERTRFALLSVNSRPLGRVRDGRGFVRLGVGRTSEGWRRGQQDQTNRSARLTIGGTLGHAVKLLSAPP